MARSTIATIPITRGCLGTLGRPQGRTSCKDAVEGLLSSFPACGTLVPAPAMASAMPPMRYTGLHVMHSSRARQIQAVKGPPWVMLTPPPVTASEALPPPAVRKKPSPVFWRPMGFLEAVPGHDRDRASSEEDNDKAAGAENLG